METDQQPPSPQLVHPHYIEVSFMDLLGHMICEESMNVQNIFDIIEHINENEQKAKDAIVVFEEVFKHESSGRIIYALEVFEYLFKNCNLNLHLAANIQSFTNSLLGLLRRLRGKFNFIERMTRNTQNWIKIEAKVLFFIQLWYDALILHEADFRYLVNLYKLLRQENITFPPRQQSEKNMISVRLQSPIFDNLPVFAETDKQQFEKRKKAVAILQVSEQITEQYKLNCLQATQSPSVSKILAPVYQQPAYRIQPQKIKQFIDLAQQLNCQPIKADYPCQQLTIFLSLKCKTQDKQLESQSLVISQLRQDAEKIVAQWRKKYIEFQSRDESYQGEQESTREKMLEVQ